MEPNLKNGNGSTLLAERVLWLIEDFVTLSRQPKTYGTGIQFHRLDIHLIHSIGREPRINVTELASLHKITKSAVSQAVKRLERRDLIERYQSDNNRKEVRFRLTDGGRVAYDAHRRFHEVSEAPFVRALSELTPVEAEAAVKLIGILENRAAYIRALLTEGDNESTT
ncbi:MAG: MarR family transcriptional regulator [Spirochaetaceae bacterium]|nr:MarR family transcriptional regulator [Spirochaetaceae bacterium]